VCDSVPAWRFLFRQEEAEMQRKLIEADLIECVLSLELAQEIDQ